LLILAVWLIDYCTADKFGVSSYPTLLLFPLGDNGVVSRDPVVYENELKAAALNDFIATYVVCCLPIQSVLA